MCVGKFYGMFPDMARAPRNDIEARRLADALDELHKLNQRPSFQTIYDDILVNHGHSMGTAEQVRKMHKGEVDPSTTDVEDLLAICRYYEVAPEEVTPLVGQRVSHLMALIAPPFPTGGPISVESGSPCTRSPLADVLPFTTTPKKKAA